MTTTDYLPIRLIGTQSSVSVTAVSTEIIAANPTRSYFLFQNQSDEDIWLNFTGNTAVADATCFLIPKTIGGVPGSLELRSPGLVSSAVTAIHTAAAATKLLTVLEG